MDKKKIIVLSVLPLLLILVINFFYFAIIKKFTDDDQTEKKEVKLITSVIDSNSDSITNSKIKAYQDAKSDSILKSRRKKTINISLLGSDDDSTKFAAINTDVDGQQKINKKLAEENDKQVNEMLSQLNSLQESITGNTKKKPSVKKKSAPKPKRTSRPKKKIKPKKVEPTPPKPKRRKARYNERNSESQAVTKFSTSAIIHGRQKVYKGAKIKMRTTTNCKINGFNIPKNTFVNGIVNFSQERVFVKVNSIVYNDKIIRVTLEAYDKDGILGIYIPGGITQDAGKEGLNQAITEAAQQGSDIEGTETSMINKLGSITSKWNSNAWANIPNDYKIYLK